jgi:hypothetical protein
MLCIDCYVDITHSARKSYQGEGSTCIACADKRDGNLGSYHKAVARQKYIKRPRPHYLRRVK